MNKTLAITYGVVIVLLIFIVFFLWRQTETTIYPPVDYTVQRNDSILRENRAIIQRLSDSVLTSLQRQNEIQTEQTFTRNEAQKKYARIRVYPTDSLDSVYTLTRLRVRTNYLGGRYRPN